MTWTIEEIKYANARAGKFFFSPNNMRFFMSRVSDEVFQGPGGIFFVTSERMDYKHPRLYNVRQFIPETGEVESDPLNKNWFESLNSAKRAARRAAEKGI